MVRADGSSRYVTLVARCMYDLARYARYVLYDVTEEAEVSMCMLFYEYNPSSSQFFWLHYLHINFQFEITINDAKPAHPP